MTTPRYNPAAIIRTPRTLPCGCLSNYADLCSHTRAGKSIFAVMTEPPCDCACHLVTCYEGMEPPRVRLFVGRGKGE